MAIFVADVEEIEETGMRKKSGGTNGTTRWQLGRAAIQREKLCRCRILRPMHVSFKLLLEGLLSDDGTDWILLHNCCRSAGGSRRVCQVDGDRLVRFLKDPLRFKRCWIEYICGGGIEDGY